MKPNYLFAWIILFSIVFQQCQNDSSPTKATPPSIKRICPKYSEYTEKIIKTDSAVIRGLNINASRTAILKAEQNPPSSDKQDTLEYSYQIDSTTYYSIKYTLNHDSLEEINIWVYSTNPDITAKIFSDLKDYYQQKLPNPIEDKGYVVYNCVQGERRPFVVSISDFSLPNKGQINLVIYKDK